MINLTIEILKNNGFSLDKESMILSRDIDDCHIILSPMFSGSTNSYVFYFECTQKEKTISMSNLKTIDDLNNILSVVNIHINFRI